ncbi:hypothetical protein NKH77_46245 [Streptomyces sp. M19]
MHFSAASGPISRHLRVWHLVLASLVVVTVVAFLVLLPSDDARSVPNSPCRATKAAREDTPVTPTSTGTASPSWCTRTPTRPRTST